MDNLELIVEIALISPLVALTVVFFIYFKERSDDKYKLGGFSLIAFMAAATLVALLASFIVVLVMYPTAQGPLSWVFIFGPFSVAFGLLFGFLIWRRLSRENKI